MDRFLQVRRWRLYQLALGVIVLMLAVFTVTQGYVLGQENDESRRCIEQKIDELTEVLNARANAVSQTQEVTQEVLESFVRAAEAQRGTKSEQVEAREAILEALHHYDEVARQSKQERRENPYPDYPAGACQSG